jgi:glycosyltransferase involved in cell wall biosynthesis
MRKPKVIRVATVSASIKYFLLGQLTFLSNFYEVIAVAGDTQFLDEIKDKENVRTEHISMKRRISILNDTRSLFNMIRFLQKEKPEIVHSLTPKAGLVTMVAAYLMGVPIRMHTFTGLVFPTQSGAYQKLLIFMDQVICYCATDVFPEGEGVKKDLIQYKVTTKPLNVLAKGNINGVDFKHYNYQLFSKKKLDYLYANNSINENDIVFIFIGRMVRDKGITETVEAFEALYRKNTSICLLLVGSLESDLDPLPKKTLSTIEQHEGIKWVGYQEDVRPYIAIADILVFSSYREGFPNVPLQCAAFKKALILTDISGCNEIIQHNVSGLLIPTKSTKKVFEAMEVLTNDAQKREVFGQNVYDFVRTNFDQKKVWNAIHEQYQIRLEELTNRY